MVTMGPLPAPGPGPYQLLADALRKVRDGETNELTCSLCSKRTHLTADHPSPLSSGACLYCFEGKCGGKPCDKTREACDCLCTTRGMKG